MPVLTDLQPAPTHTAADLLALEETLLLRLNENPRPADARPFALIHACTQPAVVLGTGQKHALVVHRANCEADGVAILRRPSGGGCVIQLPGVLWFSLGVPFDWLPQNTVGGIRGTFADVLQPICDLLLQRWNLPAELRGICDIALPADPAADTPPPSLVFRKIAGSAQCRKQRAVLVHGTLLVQPELARIDRYLPFPDKQPDYRQNRSHAEFLTTLADHPPAPTMDALKTGILRAWQTMLDRQLALLDSTTPLTLFSGPPTAAESAAAQTLAAEKYRQETWTYRL